MHQPLTSLHPPPRSARGWKAAGVVISIAIAAAAFVVLAHALKSLDGDRVLEAVWSTERWRIAAAAVLVAASYGSLTFYDLLALHAIGRKEIPYRIAALASFTSYPIAHGVGAVLPVSTAIRYRIYSARGLKAVEVAKICFLTGLTFWLGNLTALGLSTLYEPGAVSRIDHLPEPINQLLAAAMLTVIAGYLCWTWNNARHVGRAQWSVKLPAGHIVLLQIGIGIVDLGCAALALYMLIPAGMNAEIPRVVVVFIAAMLLGFASHTPGGIGVFDATVLLGFEDESREPILAALILFRLFYHLVPFVLALIIFGGREAWQGAQGRSRR
jgi:uncharacterized membrane protein YbhN (UPF0104 family)